MLFDCFGVTGCHILKICLTDNQGTEHKPDFSFAFFEIKFHYVVQNSLETTLWLVLASNSSFSCFCLRCAGITGIHHSTSGLISYFLKPLFI